MNSILSVFNLVDHIIPVLITLAVIVAVVMYRIGFPYLRHIYLVSQASNFDGEMRLARHLARQAGGKRIEVSELWTGFIPAARALHADHVIKRDSVN